MQGASASRNTSFCPCLQNFVRHHWVHRRRQEGKCKQCGKVRFPAQHKYDTGHLGVQSSQCVLLVTEFFSITNIWPLLKANDKPEMLSITVLIPMWEEKDSCICRNEHIICPGRLWHTGCWKWEGKLWLLLIANIMFLQCCPPCQNFDGLFSRLLKDRLLLSFCPSTL